jgi:hypothetical protein
MAIKFDPTIKYGDLLTFGAMVVTVTISFSILDKRISVLEERSRADSVVAVSQQSEQKETLKEIRSDIRDLQKSVNEVSRAVASRPNVRIP